MRPTGSYPQYLETFPHTSAGVWTMPKSARMIATINHKPNENCATWLRIIFADYANRLRAQYPNRTIRNSDVFSSAIVAFSRRKLIALVKAKSAIPVEVPNFLIHNIRRTKHFPIWMPTRKIGSPIDNLLRPVLQGDRIVWKEVRKMT